jgi:peptide/nickel transport system permease protein
VTQPPVDVVDGAFQANREPDGTGRRTTEAGWLGFVARRLVRLVFSLFLLVSATFCMVQLIPGDPVRASLGEQATEDLVRMRMHELGLDRPLPEQYASYLAGVARGDLGESIESSEPVAHILGERFPNTLQLALPAFVLVVLIALPVGLLAAVRTRGGTRPRVRSGFVGVTGVMNSIPDFVLATVLSAVFVVSLKAFPAAGDVGFASHVLPVTALVVGPAASLSRIVRVEALKVLDAEYIRAARSRRLPARLFYVRHVLPNMVTASLTYGGLVLAGLIAGTVLVENVFGWPGLGTEISQAVIQKDYPLIQGILLALGALVLGINLVIDVTLGVLDPRSRIREG